MAVDKLKIKTIEEGQTGQMVADNLKANFEFLADEIDKKTDTAFYEGVGEAVTTLANLPIAKRSIVANITSASTLSLSGNLKAGQDLYIRVYNNSDGEILLPIPNTGLFVSMSGVSVKIPSRKFIEMSVWCYGESQYSIRVGEIAK